MNKSKLITAREKAGLTQTEVAKMLNISSVSLHYYETGQRNLPKKIAIKLSNIYKVKMEDIFLPESFSAR